MPIVQQVRLGSSGLKISPIIVGCMSFGSKSWAPWLLDDKEEIFKILKYCYDNGLRTFDTADIYSNGLSERLIGEFLRNYNINRETVVILSKVNFPVDESLDLSVKSIFNVDEVTALTLTNQRGLSRKHIIDGVAKSVERLGTYIDVLQIHRFDSETTMEETMRALNDVVESGHARYIGASSMLATEFSDLQFTVERNGWFKFISSQSQYNLLYREDERELIPYAKRHGIGLIPWSPNARGLLTRPVGVATERSSSDPRFQKLTNAGMEIINRVEEVANRRNVSMVVASNAWVLHKGCHPIVGMSSTARVDEAVQALTFKLTDEEVKYIEEPYRPKSYE
ncbi:aldo-keto reductase superfamily protein [Lachancea thermotolerans CBS 6340]|uniref:KLTH0A08052p n=1 Tax=Lachancea thermotolerans (strain ATCC 56472 / CBS 6340 / NRRL Y-8284) TaxID=559295 RepID=C5DC54_LACTC|nr:KLTH0A08052p [Lachancea thermotolerans CBS 6340]CAR21362.1 KLTH0A08052p [Lachancea thermotolerans CBS 6340]